MISGKSLVVSARHAVFLLVSRVSIVRNLKDEYAVPSPFLIEIDPVCRDIKCCPMFHCALVVLQMVLCDPT